MMWKRRASRCRSMFCLLLFCLLFFYLILFIIYYLSFIIYHFFYFYILSSSNSFCRVASKALPPSPSCPLFRGHMSHDGDDEHPSHPWCPSPSLLVHGPPPRCKLLIPPSLSSRQAGKQASKQVHLKCKLDMS